MRVNRTLWRWVVLGLVVGASLCGSTGGAATLRWKFRQGETLHYVMEQKSVTQTKGGGQDAKYTESHTIDYDLGVKAVDDAGKGDMTFTITRIRSRIELPLGMIKNDTDDPNTGEVARSLKPLIGAPFSFKMSPEGECTDIKLPAEVSAALKKSANGGAPSPLSEDVLKNMITQANITFPKEELTPGKTWPHEERAAMPFGTMVVKMTFRYQGPDAKAGGASRIELQTDDVEIKPAPGAEFQVKITAREGKGSFLFDESAGRIVDASIVQKLEAVIAIQDKEISQTSEQSRTTKLKTDKAPDAAK